MATTLKTDVTDPYPVYLVLLHLSKEFRWYNVDHGYTLVGVFSDSISEFSNGLARVDLEHKNPLAFSSLDFLRDLLPALYSKDYRDVKLQILNNAMDQILQPLSFSLH